MFPFDTTVATDDDLIVLAAYAEAEEAAAAARKEREATKQAAAESADLAETDAGSDNVAEDVGATTDQPAMKGQRHTWVSRLREIDGVEQDRMAPIHGRLIAHGLLQFQLQGREDGVVYRVTTAGHQLLAMTPAADRHDADAA